MKKILAIALSGLIMCAHAASMGNNDLGNQLIVGWEGVLPPGTAGPSVIDLGPAITNTPFIPTEIILRNFSPRDIINCYLDLRNTASGPAILAFGGNGDFIPTEEYPVYQFFPLIIKPSNIRLGNDIITGDLYVGNDLSNNTATYIEILGYAVNTIPSASN